MFHNVTDDKFTTNWTTVGIRFPSKPSPTALISSATAHTVLTVVQAGILPVLTIAGVIMNVINMAVFLRQGLSDRINLCLFSLAVADTGYISMSMISRLYSIFGLFDATLIEYWKVQSLKMVGIYMGFLTSSNCLTLLISVERCVCVLWPLKAKNLLSVRYMKVVIVFLFLLCLSCCCPVCFRYYTASYRDRRTNTLRYYNRPTAFYIRNRLVMDIISETIFNLTVPIMCLIGVLLATLLISWRMHVVLSWRQQTAHVGASTTVTSGDRRESLVTRMLLVVCVVFTICMIPSAAQSLSRFSVPNFEPGRRHTNLFYVTICLAHLAATINSSGNFLIYWTMSTKFKDTFRSLCGNTFKAPKSEHIIE